MPFAAKRLIRREHRGAKRAVIVIGLMSFEGWERGGEMELGAAKLMKPLGQLNAATERARDRSVFDDEAASHF